MKPKPNHFIRMRIYKGNKLLSTYQASTAEQLKIIVGCPIGRIYKNYKKGRISLKVAELCFEIDQIKYDEPNVIPPKITAICV